MNISYLCPHCGQSVRQDLSEATKELGCGHCGQQILVPSDGLQGGRIERCLVCPSRDLYVRKDVPQRFGVGVVVAGIVASSIAWGYHQPLWTFGILFATALVDFVLFFIVGNSLMCYRCQAQYRGIDEMETYGGFNLETHERYRQLAARLSQSSSVPSQRTY